MGVKGLWKLLDGTGRSVDLESLEGKILAVDISVWLNMAVKGMRDYQGHSMENAHLITLFSRICKLLYYGIKPIFVFDGKAPLLKQNTLHERRQKKDYSIKQSNKASEKVLQNYLKKQILKETFDKESSEEKPESSHATSSGNDDNKSYKKHHEADIYELPPLTTQLDNDDSDDEMLNLHTDFHNQSNNVSSLLSMNVDSQDFNALPPDIQYEMLKDIKEVRKRRRTHLEAMPENSDSFSGYQLAGLLEKRKISKKMENVEHRMMEDNVASSSLRVGLHNDVGKNYDIHASQLISDSSSHYIWMQNLNKLDNKEKLETIIKENEVQNVAAESTIKTTVKKENGASSQETVTLDHSSNPYKSPIKNVSISMQHDTYDSEISSVLKAEVNDNDTCVNTTEESVMEINHFNTKSTPLHSSEERVSVMNEITEYHMEHKVPVEDRQKSPNDTSLQLNVVQSIEELSAKERESPKVPCNEVAGEQNNEKTSDITPEDDSKEEDDDFEEVEDVIIKTKKEKEGKINIDLSEASAEDIPNEKIVPNPWAELKTDDDIERFTNRLDAETLELQKMAQAKERESRDVSQSAQFECQELIKLFGLPFIVSPQEAEAQCASLELLGLTNGTITEDSDIWLFGGKYVIKSMFDSKNDPVAFNVTDIQMELSLNRDRFICIGMCSGSDYTCGIDGVGPVTAMEILEEFTGEGISGLKDFKKWWKDVSTSTKEARPMESKIKSQLQRLNLKEDFPSEAVYNAYIHPIVDDTNSTFEWDFPDLDELRSFAINVIGWTKQRVNKALLPVVKKIGEQRSVQTKMTHFLPLARVLKKKKSRRVQNAVARISGKPKKAPSNSKSKKVLIAPKDVTELNLSECSDES